MAFTDIPDIQSSQTVKVVGSDSTGVEQTPVRSTASGDLGTTDVIVTGGVQAAISVSTTAVEAKVSTSRYSNRKVLTITPTNGTIYWGYTNTVTTASGTPILKNEKVTFAIGDVAIYLIGTAATDVRITEGA